MVRFSRRSFLLSSSAMAMSLLSTRAMGRVRGAPQISQFNGGRSQIQPWLLGGSGTFAFLNAMKEGGSWVYTSTGATVNPSELDANGYPTSLPSGGVSSVFTQPSQTERPGNYCITWDGNGTIYTNLINTVLPTATFTGSVTGGVLTAGAPSGGTIQKGMRLSTGGIIGDQITGSAGQAGTYSGIGLTTAGSQSMNVSGGSKTSSTGSGRYVFSTTSTDFDVGISTITGPAITNMKVFHVDDESAILAGQVFGTKFKSILAESRAGVLRHLDWQLGNGSNVTTWATRKPVGYHCYNGSQYRPDLYAGVTTNSGNDYSITFGSGAPTDKLTIHLNFNADATSVAFPVTFSSTTFANRTAHGLTAGEGIAFSSDANLPTGLWSGINYYVLAAGLTANAFQFATTPGGTPVAYGTGASGTITCTRSPTLNLNGTGAVQIRNEWGDPLGTSALPDAVNGGGRTIYGTVIYDAALNSWFKYGADTTGSQGLRSGVPPEICLQLCTELGMHPYFCTPFLTIDPATDYMTELAKLVKNTGPSWMIPRFEGVNELWNNALGFYGTRYSWTKGFLAWGSQFDQDNWQGKTVSVLGQLINAVYGGTPSTQTKYQVLCGVQTVGGTNPTAFNPRLTSAKYVTDGGSAAYNWATHVVCANYFNPSEQFEAQELIDAYNYSVTYSANPTQQAVIVASYIDTLNSGAGDFCLSTLNTYYVAWAGWAASNWGGSINLKLTGYEGGYSPDYTNANSFSQISGATVTSGTTVDLTISTYRDGQKTTYRSGNPAVVGMQMIVTNVGGMTQLNGNTYSVAGVSGNTVTITVPDTTGFGAYTSGGNSQWVNSLTYINVLRKAGKNAPNLQGYLYGNLTGNKSNYQNFLNAGGEFPSCYMLAGSNQVWSLFDPNIYATPSTQFAAIKAFNA